VTDLSNSPILHYLNGKSYKISKSFGFVSAPNFRDFPNETSIHQLIGAHELQLGVHNIDRNQVYDFEIGDEFHIKTYHNHVIYLEESHYFKIIIIGKSQDNNGDWQYTYDVQRHVVNVIIPDQSWNIYEDSSGIIPPQLLPNDFANNEPGVFLENFYSNYGSTELAMSIYNNRNEKLDKPVSPYDLSPC